MKQITTKSGFSVEINEEVLDDIEVFDCICELEEGDIKAYRKLISKILKPEDKERLYDHVRQVDGRVPTSLIGNEVAEIIAGCGKK